VAGLCVTSGASGSGALFEDLSLVCGQSGTEAIPNAVVKTAIRKFATCFAMGCLDSYLYVDAALSVFLAAHMKISTRSPRIRMRSSAAIHKSPASTHFDAWTDANLACKQQLP
jgi:hypothetical protein